eukprot:m.114406 g.114406  ORF g.114406 m.114406 type:complete len:75 (-) comp28346_c1_seq1:115-339(-)
MHTTFYTQRNRLHYLTRFTQFTHFTRFLFTHFPNSHHKPRYIVSDIDTDTECTVLYILQNNHTPHNHTHTTACF